jgi:hypothetical protein
MTIKPIEIPEPTYTEYQGWDKWEEKFKPIKNHLVNDPDQQMFETYGEEVDYVTKADNKYVWTWIQGDMSDLIVAGYHYVNRLGYYITEVPWDDEYDYALLSVEVECECYSDDDEVMTSRNNDFGDPSCPECEGYGMVTKYVD